VEGKKDCPSSPEALPLSPRYFTQLLRKREAKKRCPKAHPSLALQPGIYASMDDVCCSLSAAMAMGLQFMDKKGEMKVEWRKMA